MMRYLYREHRKLTRLVIVVVFTIISLGLPQMTAHALTAGGMMKPMTLHWQKRKRCGFGWRSGAWAWVEVRVDVVDGKRKFFQAKVKSEEPISYARLWERRGETEYYKGMYQGNASNNWTSPVTKLPYLKAGETWAMIKLWREGDPDPCHLEVMMYGDY